MEQNERSNEHTRKVSSTSKHDQSEESLLAGGRIRKSEMNEFCADGMSSSQAETIVRAYSACQPTAAVVLRQRLISNDYDDDEEQKEDMRMADACIYLATASWLQPPNRPRCWPPPPPTTNRGTRVERVLWPIVLA